jgi:hypothetical protein
MNRTALLANLVIMGGVLAFMASWEEGASPGTLAFFSGIMMAFVPVMIVTREDKFQAMALGCSLPVTRETIVRSRYVLSVTSAVGGIFLAFVVSALAPTSQLGLGALFRPAVVLQAVATTTLVISLLLPFTLRFGALGLILVLAGSQVFGIVALTVVKISESSADRRFLDSIVHGVRQVHTWAGPGGFYLLLVLFLALVLLVSYALSVWVFRRREL